MARPRDNKSHAGERMEAQASSSHGEATSPPKANLLSPTSLIQPNVVDLTFIHPYGITADLTTAPQAVANLKPNQVPVTAPPAAPPVVDEPSQEVMPTNINNLSAAKWPTNMTKEPVTSITHSEIQASITPLDWEPPYPPEVAAKPYPPEYKVPKFQKYDEQKGNIWEHVLCFLNTLCP